METLNWAPALFAPTNPPARPWPDNSSTEQYVIFADMALLSRTNKNGSKQYWRHIHTDSKNMYVLKVVPGKTLKNSAKVTIWSLRAVGGLLGTAIVQEHEIVRPEWMNAKNKSEKERIAIAERFNKIKDLVAEPIGRLVSDTTYRNQKLREAAEVFKVKVPRIRTLLTRYWYFGGGGADAMSSLHLFKGASGKSRMDITKNKMGRPNYATVLGSAVKYSGRNMTRTIYRRLEKIIADAPKGGAHTNASLVRAFYASRFAKNRNQDGEIASFPIAREKLPSPDLIRVYLSKIILEGGYLKTLLGNRQYRNTAGSRLGHTRDIISGSQTIVDFDGTTFNFEMCLDTRRKSISKPTTMFAVERNSDCILGFSVSFGNENADSYRHCLYSVLQPKTTLLKQYNLEALEDGFPYGVFDTMFVDRGPGIASASLRTAVELAIDADMAPPGSPQSKAVVENVNKLLQHGLSSLPGGYIRANNDDTKKRHRNARKNGICTLEQFMRLLITAIYDHNCLTQLPHLLTVPMLNAGVQPNPKAIYAWNRRHDIGKSYPELTQKKVLLKTLTRLDNKTVTDGTVIVDGQRYTCGSLKALYEKSGNLASGAKKKPRITIYLVPNTNEEIIWAKDENTFFKLFLMRESKRIHGVVTPDEVKHNNKRRRAAAIKQSVDTIPALPGQIAQVLYENIGCSSKAEIKNIKENRKQAREVMADAAKGEIYKALNIETQLGESRLEYLNSSEIIEEAPKSTGSSKVFKESW